MNIDTDSFFLRNYKVKGVIHIRELLSTKELRRLCIIELLTDCQDSMTFYELAEALGASVRTIHADIDLVSEYSFFFEVNTNGQSITLTYARNQSIQKVYSYLLTTSPAYKFITEIMLEGTVTLEHLQSKLDISRSSIYRLSLKINDALNKHFNIGLDQNPFTFVGDEIDIRYFLTHFIAEKYAEIPVHLCPQVDFSAFDQMIIQVADVIGFDMEYAKLRVVRILTIVNIIRTKLDYFVENMDISQTVIKLISQMDMSLYQDYLKFMKALDLPHEPLYISNIFTGLLATNSFFTEEELKQSLDTNAELRHIVGLLDKQITQLSEDYQLEVPDKDELIYYLYQTVKFYKFEVKSSYILYNEKGKFIEQLEKQYPAFVQAGLEAMEEFLNQVLPNYAPEFLDHLYYTLFTHWKTLSQQLFEQNQKINTLVLSSFDIYHAHLLKECLSWQLGNLVDIEVYTGNFFDLNDLSYKLKNDKYSLIIANCPLPNVPNKQTISIHSIPTEEDINHILSIVKEIQNKSQT